MYTYLKDRQYYENLYDRLTKERTSPFGGVFSLGRIYSQNQTRRGSTMLGKLACKRRIAPKYSRWDHQSII